MKNAGFVVLGLIALIALVAALGATFHGVPWYEELKTWQDGIAAVIAFAGLIAAALVGLGGVRSQIAANASEARQQHEREQTTEKLRIAAALAGEVDAVVQKIRIGRQAFEDELNERDGPTARRILFVAALESDRLDIPPMRIYEGLGDRIGTLGPAIVEHAAGFHTRLESARRNYWNGHVAEAVTTAEHLAEQAIVNYFLASGILIELGDWLLYELKSFIAETTGEEPPEPPTSDDLTSHRPDVSVTKHRGAEEDATDSPARSA